MPQSTMPLWELVAAQYRRSLVPGLADQVAAVLTSEPVRMLRDRLAAQGQRIGDQPQLWKQLPGGLLRLFLPVHGSSPAVEDGQVVAVVTLHDLGTATTLYAHPVHAGPHANPLLKHLYGPMNQPRAQEGTNGERATLRLLEHKRAIWQRFLEERDELGSDEAGRRWRKRYAWSLVRLYFCERCPGCMWGWPSYDGVRGEPYRATRPPLPTRVASDIPAAALERLRGSAAWRVETAYVARGGFAVREEPLLAARAADGAIVAAFATDAEFVEAGVPVGLMLYADATGARVLYAHVLTAGPEPEPALLHGDQTLGLPAPQAQAAAARRAYVRWREQAWPRFWLHELEEGLDAASRWWRAEFWNALARLFDLQP